MPIQPQNRKRYPANWPEIRARIQARACDHCEWCGVKNGRHGVRHPATGVFHELRAGTPEVDRLLGAGVKIIRIVCTTAHVHDPAPENCDDDNLAFLCQRCHLNHDRPHHLAVQRQNREQKRGQLRLEVAA